VQQEGHRLFLLNTIYNGIKDDLDFRLLNNTPLLKMLFSCYGCPLSDRKIDLMVLKIINKIVVKTSKVEFLTLRYGLALWIFQAADKVEAFEYDAIEMILALIENSFDALQKEVNGKDNSSGKRLLAAVLTLLPKFTKARLTGSGFVSFLKTVNGISEFSFISQENRDLIFDLVKVFVPSDLLRSVTYFINHPEATIFNQPGTSLSTDDITTTIIDHSRRFFVSYHKK
jgi:hypothetical protein